MSTTIKAKVINLPFTTHLFLHLILSEMCPQGKPEDPDAPAGLYSLYRKMCAMQTVPLDDDEFDALMSVLEFEKDKAQDEEPGGPMATELNRVYQGLKAQEAAG